MGPRTNENLGRRRTDPTSWDASIARALGGRFQFESRRSFLSKVTRTVFALVGVGVAVWVPLFRVPAGAPALGDQPESGAVAANPWTWCGLRGHVCTAGTPCSTAGQTQGGAWQHCCQNPADNCWYAISYVDWCGVAPASGTCIGNPPSGPSWCYPDTLAYNCTTVTVISGNTPMTTSSGCSAVLNSSYFCY